VPLGTYDIIIGIKGRGQKFHSTGFSTKVVQEQLPRKVFEEVDQDEFDTLEGKYEDILQT